MGARIPGTSDHEPQGVRLARHDVRVTIHDGFARTEVDEEFHNDTDRVLEGVLEFPIPRGASVSRMALWVGPRLVEAEMVERSRGSSVFRGIVDETVRPRDPALLEKTSNAALTLRVFPIAAYSSRRVTFSYDEPLVATATGFRYVYPLSAGENSSISINRFTIDVSVREAGQAPERVTTNWDGGIEKTAHDSTKLSAAVAQLLPVRDFVVEYPKASSAALAVSHYRPKLKKGSGQHVPFRASERHEPHLAVAAKDGTSTYFAVRVPIAEALKDAAGTPTQRIVVIDKSASQSSASLRETARVALALAREARFALFACDSACVSFPARGVARPEAATLARAKHWLDNLEPSGASDVEGAWLAALRRAGSAAQIVYFGDGQPSAGALGLEAIARSIVAARSGAIDLEFVAQGPTADESVLEELAARTGGSGRTLRGPAAFAERATALRAALSRPTLKDVRAEFDVAVDGAVVRRSTSDAASGDLLVMAKTGGKLPNTIDVVGRAGDHTQRVRYALHWPARSEPGNPLLPRLWAEARIAGLEHAADQQSLTEAERLSMEHHVVSREASLIALENDAMFEEFGIRQRSRPPVAKRSQRVSRVHKARPPKIRMAMTMVSGRTPPETIRRTVHQSFGRFRACYHKGLLRNPKLSGRVTVRFVIARDGSVAAAMDGGSTLANADVITCMVDASRKLVFTKPEGGPITVDYPFALSPDTATAAHRETGPQMRRRLGSGPPRIEVLAGDDIWIYPTPLRNGEVLASAAEADTRGQREWQIRDYLAHGRFDAAQLAATLWAAAEPKSRPALSVLAQTSLLSGDRPRLLAAAAGSVELDPRDPGAQEFAARVFTRAGERARACGHWRALASLPIPDALTQANARTCLETDGMPTLPSPRAQSEIQATVQCARATRRCPTLALIADDGSVRTVLDSGRDDAVFLASLGGATWRLLRVGGDSDARGTVRVSVAGEKRTYPFGPDSPRAVVTLRHELLMQ